MKTGEQLATVLRELHEIGTIGRLQSEHLLIRAQVTTSCDFLPRPVNRK
jgi:hypothetical protein